MSSDDLKKSVADAASRANEAGADAATAASGYASKASDHAGAMADKASDTASDLYSQARAKLHDAAAGMPGSTSEALEQGQKAYAQGSEQVASQVKKQPIEALLLAAAVGYLVGWATSR